MYINEFCRGGGGSLKAPLLGHSRDRRPRALIEWKLEIKVPASSSLERFSGKLTFARGLAALFRFSVQAFESNFEYAPEAWKQSAKIVADARSKPAFQNKDFFFSLPHPSILVPRNFKGPLDTTTFFSSLQPDLETFFFHLLRGSSIARVKIRLTAGSTSSAIHASRDRREDVFQWVPRRRDNLKLRKFTTRPRFTAFEFSCTLFSSNEGISRARVEGNSIKLISCSNDNIDIREGVDWKNNDAPCRSPRIIRFSIGWKPAGWRIARWWSRSAAALFIVRLVIIVVERSTSWLSRGGGMPEKSWHCSCSTFYETLLSFQSTQAWVNAGHLAAERCTAKSKENIEDSPKIRQIKSRAVFDIAYPGVAATAAEPKLLFSPSPPERVSKSISSRFIL